MLHGPPSPLHPGAPLVALSRRASAGEVLGAWLRGRRRVMGVRVGGRRLVVAGDLGALLRRVRRVAVLDRGRIVVAEGEELIAWRTLQIIIGAPFLPPPLHRFRSLFPDVEMRGSRLTVPLRRAAPEEALAACVAERLRVVGSWVDYRG